MNHLFLGFHFCSVLFQENEWTVCFRGRNVLYFATNFISNAKMLFYRDQCEELRSTRSKRMQDQVIRERMEQLALKEERTRAEKREEQMFADLWHADMMAKVHISFLSSTDVSQSSQMVFCKQINSLLNGI